MKILALLTFFSTIQSGSTQLPAAPIMPFVDRGACPFEGCVYRDWKAKRQVVAYEMWDSRASVRPFFTVRPGETVTAMTGVVIVTAAGRARIFREVSQKGTSRDFPNQSVTVTLHPNDMVYLLTYHGEGGYTAWFRGVLFDLDTSDFQQPDVPGAVYSACVRTQTCKGEVLEYPKKVWWVQIRNATGQIGWTDHTTNQDFEGQDRFGLSQREADQLVQQLRELSPIMAMPSPEAMRMEQRRRDLYSEFRQLGDNALPALREDSVTPMFNSEGMSRWR